MIPGRHRTRRTAADLADINLPARGTSGWTVTPGSYALMVGDSSANLPLVTHVEVSS